EVSIYGRGKLLMEGTSGNPVEIVAATDRPWGCIGLQGPGSAGSRFRHLKVSGGSVGQFRGIRFKGMVNVYTSSDLVMEGCQVGPNQVGDDAVNLADTEAVIRNCHWSGARADGLDLDRCQALIEGCTFSSCANDGLDLMSSQVQLRDSTFTDCGDKALSVGEASRLVGRKLVATGCPTAVLVKDSSQAALIEARLEGNQLAVDCYQENWLYPRGGSALLWKVELAANRRELQADKASFIELCQTSARTLPEAHVSQQPSSLWSDLIADQQGQ
ncbi:MAG: right-handed parallel beta-helix repeat-containing protein, partial [Candidatus Eremiobacteraeota bacterium]|nr:right-handed parallel beta-helix repeat-containing protein [Candidatus Eremiobacteraeota bacterium]